jgi:hypothetical protein
MSNLSPDKRDAKKRVKWIMLAQATSSAPTLQQTQSAAAQTQNQTANAGGQNNARSQLPMQT